MRVIRYSIILLLGILTLVTTPALNAAPPPPGQISPGDVASVENALLSSAKTEILQLYSIPLFDTEIDQITFSTDNTWASAWLVMINPSSGEAIPAEPTLALAQWDGVNWTAILPADPGWRTALTKAPSELMSAETRQTWLSINAAQLAEQPQAPIHGYLLPWERGKTVYLSRSVQHDADFPSGAAHYAFDFYVPQTMFDIHAARSGSVWLFKDDIPNDTHSSVNYLVLQDASTSPTTYQLYLHLAQNSIPSNLKTIGTPVAQGQLIGIADNTGQSTGHHLHFQVETTPSWTYWGTSIDITFDDVDVNGGRPRVSVDFPYCTRPDDVCTTSRSAYVSGNNTQPRGNPPYGDISAPENGLLLQNSNLTLSAWTGDTDGTVVETRLIAKYGASWVQIGPAFYSSTFIYSWDVCASAVPDGPVSLALQILDSDGNWATGLPGLRHVIKHYACPPPPTCFPSSNQIALYSDPDYQGDCKVFSTGSFTTSSAFGTLGVDQAASIKVGANVISTLYANSNLTGRGDTFFSNDSNLGDNNIGAETVSSLKVLARSASPSVPTPGYPADSATFAGNTSQSLAWDDGGGAQEYQVELDGVTQPWQSEPSFHIGSSALSTHTWRVRSRNPNGQSNYSPARTFTVSNNADSPVTIQAPFTDSMENGYNGWSNSSNWDQTLAANHTQGGQVSWKYEVNAAPVGYDNGVANSGDLTSPPISIPSTGYFLHFWYLYETEGPGVHWDQRWVQLSVNGGAFANLLQLSDDPPNTWLKGPVINLASYANATIRVRFHFETLDAAFNTNKGWFIDDFSIDQVGLPSCSDPGEPDNFPAQARSLAYGSSINGAICPGGDLDYFTFIASGTGKTGIATSAQSAGSPLDTMIFLLDSDGKSVLASNDDQISAVRTDSYLSYSLTPGRTYYIKLRAWDHPSGGGGNYTYTIYLFGNDTSDPSAQITSPPEGTFLPNGANNIVASATDAQTSISHVEFYWHSGDWQYSNWGLLGADWVGSDGWSASLDTTAMADQKDIAFLARVYDWAGNRTDVANWNLAIDRTPPVTAIQALPPLQTGTAIKVTWTAADNLSGLDHFDLQQKTDSGSWQNWLLNLPGENREGYFVGATGHSYSFRMRGVDRLGNTEVYPTNAEASTSIPSAVCSSGDQWENDNSPTSARTLYSSMIGETHTICNPAPGSGWLNDQDWLKIGLEAGYRLSVIAEPQNNGSAPVLQLYDSTAAGLLKEVHPSDHGQGAQLVWVANQDSSVYLKITDLDGRVAGDGMTYQLQLQIGYPVFFPLIR